MKNLILYCFSDANKKEQTSIDDSQSNQELRKYIIGEQPTRNEMLVAKHFVEQGYAIIKSNQLCCLDEISHRLKQKYGIRINELKGMPDFIVFSKDEEFFVEVKTNFPSLIKSQLDWIMTHKIKVKIALLK